MHRTGLRERKKQATRAALTDAAWALAADHGLDAVTVDDIANAAGVSPRTFFNYFSSKEEAIVDRSTQLGLELVSALHERPADESLGCALEVAVLATLKTILADTADGWWLKMRKIREENPSIFPYQLARYEAIERSLAEELAARTGTDVDADQYPMVAAASFISCWRVAWSRWSADQPEAELFEGVRQALRQVLAGLGEPKS